MTAKVKGIIQPEFQRELENQMIISIEKILGVIDAGSLPPKDDCVTLRQLFQEYKDRLSHGISVSHTTGGDTDKSAEIHVDFSDTTEEKVKSNDVIADLLADPGAVMALFITGIQKIVDDDGSVIPEGNKKFLINKGYITKLTVTVDQRSRQYLMLTSKGWLCFRRNAIAEQLRKSLGIQAVIIPEWLTVSQSAWRPEAFYRTIMLHDYYAKAKSDRQYMVFPFPGADQLMFGCLADAGETVDYVCSLSEKAPLNAEEKDTLLTIIESDMVNHLTIVMDETMDKKQLVRSLKLDTLSAGKIEMVSLEAENE